MRWAAARRFDPSCVRLTNRDALDLAANLRKGTPVTITDPHQRGREAAAASR
jgi:hypothetical protein